jgi:hypothetical protein
MNATVWGFPAASNLERTVCYSGECGSRIATLTDLFWYSSQSIVDPLPLVNRAAVNLINSVDRQSRDGSAQGATPRMGTTRERESTVAAVLFLLSFRDRRFPVTSRRIVASISPNALQLLPLAQRLLEGGGDGSADRLQRPRSLLPPWRNSRSELNEAFTDTLALFLRRPVCRSPVEDVVDPMLFAPIPAH